MQPRPVFARNSKLAARFGASRYSLWFHTYRLSASLAVATLRPAFLVARFSAERTFSLDCSSCASGTLLARSILQIVQVVQNRRDNQLVLSVAPLRHIGLHHGLEMHRRFLP